MSPLLKESIEVGLAAVELAGIFTALHAVARARTPQGAIAWALALAVVPWVALPLYLIFGRSRFAGYIEARRRGNSEIGHLFEEVQAGLQPYFRDAGAGQADRIYEQLAPLPFTHGNDVRLLVDGMATFTEIFAAIEGAHEYLLLQFFIVRDDVIGRELQARLIRRAREGLRICFLYDEIGSHALPRRYVRGLRAAGVDIRAFHSARGPWNRFQINFRNHRKVLVADGRVALVGGINAGDEYLGRNPRFGPWRDTHLRVEGPAVQCIQLGFVEDWYWAARHVPERLQWMPVAAAEADRLALVMPTGPADDFETCSLFFTAAIHAARQRVWITSPYFVPDQAVADALRLAALRGVDVRIVLPQNPDHLLVYLSAFSYIDAMLRAGVKLYRYRRGFLHQKVLLVDDDLSAIGTANLDNRSFLLNFELIVLLRDRAIAAGVAAMLERDLRECRAIGPDEFRRRPFFFRAAVALARLMSPVQ